MNSSQVSNRVMNAAIKGSVIGTVIGSGITALGAGASMYYIRRRRTNRGIVTERIRRRKNRSAKFSGFRVTQTKFDPPIPAVSGEGYVPYYTSKTTLSYTPPSVPARPSFDTGGSAAKALVPALLVGAAAIGTGNLWMRYVHPKLARGLSQVGLVDKKVFIRKRKTKKGKVVIEQVRR